MKNKKEDLLFNKTLRIFLFAILPLLALYIVFGTNITGFSIDNSQQTQISTITLVAGAFLGTMTIFFIFLLAIIKIKEKSFKPSFSKS